MRLDVGFLVCLTARTIRDETVLSGWTDKARHAPPTMALEFEVRFGSVGGRRRVCGCVGAASGAAGGQVSRRQGRRRTTVPVIRRCLSGDHAAGTGPVRNRCGNSEDLMIAAGLGLLQVRDAAFRPCGTPYRSQRVYQYPIREASGSPSVPPEQHQAALTSCRVIQAQATQRDHIYRTHLRSARVPPEGAGIRIDFRQPPEFD